MVGQILFGSADELLAATYGPSFASRFIPPKPYASILTK